MKRNRVLNGLLKKWILNLKEVIIKKHTEGTKIVRLYSDKEGVVTAGDIEQDADMVMFLYSTDYYDQINSQNSEIEILLAKHRNGATGSFTLMFEKNMSSFKNYIKGEETNNE